MISLQPRTGPLARRERILIGVAGAAALAVVGSLLWPSEEDGESVELSAAPPAQTPPPAAAPPPASAAPAAAPAPAAASLDGVVLKGIFGGGPRGGSAIILFPGGQERLVRVGREVVPGMTLKSLGVSHAILAGTGGEARLDLGRAGAAVPPSAAPQVAAASAPATRAAEARETMSYRLGLQPVKTGEHVASFAIKPGANLPKLAAAGLQPGDVIVAVNGSRFDEERMMELAWQTANSDQTEVEYMRGGKRMKAVILKQ